MQTILINASNSQNKFLANNNRLSIIKEEDKRKKKKKGVKNLHQLKRLCFCTTPTKPAFVLWCNYAERTLVMVSGRLHYLVWSTVQTRSVSSNTRPRWLMISCEHNQRQLLHYSIYPISFTMLGSPGGMVYMHFPNLTHTGTVSHSADNIKESSFWQIEHGENWR